MPRAKGFVHSEETKRKMSLSHSGDKNHLFGKRFTEEHRKNLSLAHLGQPCWCKGKKRSENDCKNIGLGKRGKPGWLKGLTAKTDPRVQKFVDIMREAILRKMETGWRMPVRWKETKPERLIEDGLLKRGFMVQKQKHILGIGLVDFYLPEENLIVEVDGDFWHAHPDKYKDEDILYLGKTAKDIREKDRIKTEKMKRIGYSVVRFWETDINKNLETCLSKVGGTDVRFT